MANLFLNESFCMKYVGILMLKTDCSASVGVLLESSVTCSFGVVILSSAALSID